MERLPGTRPKPRNFFGYLGAVAAVAFLAPTGALAQACVGSAAMTGQFTLGGYAQLTDGATGYGVDSQSNLPNRASMGARLGRIDLDEEDESLLSAGVNLALDFGRTGISVCPVVGVGYDQWSGQFAGVDLEYSRTSFPIGLGAGSRLGTGPIFIPSGRAGLLHARHSGSAQIGSGTFRRTDDTTDLFLDADATLLLGRIYAQAGIFQLFEDEADPVFRLGVGVTF